MMYVHLVSCVQSLFSTFCCDIFLCTCLSFHFFLTPSCPNPVPPPLLSLSAPPPPMESSSNIHRYVQSLPPTVHMDLWWVLMHAQPIAYGKFSSTTVSSSVTIQTVVQNCDQIGGTTDWPSAKNETIDRGGRWVPWENLECNPWCHSRPMKIKIKKIKSIRFENQ